MLAAGALVLWAMQPSVAVGGGAMCPLPEDVARHLGDLMAQVPDGTPQDRAVLTEIGPRLRIDLVRPDGGRIAERELPRDGACSDLASATAFHSNQGVAPRLLNCALEPPYL